MELCSIQFTDLFLSSSFPSILYLIVCVCVYVCVWLVSTIQKAPPLSSSSYTAISQRVPCRQHSTNPFEEMRRMDGNADSSAEYVSDQWHNIAAEFKQKCLLHRPDGTVYTMHTTILSLYLILFSICFLRAFVCVCDCGCIQLCVCV